MIDLVRVATAILVGAALVAPASAGDRKWGFIDKTGKLVIPARYERASDFSQDLVAAVEPGKGWGLLDKAGKAVTAFQFQMIGDLCEGLAVVKQDGRYGYIDARGKVVIPITLEYASSFSEGRAGFKRGSAYGFIDKKGAVAVAPKYYDVGPYREGLARVALTQKTRGYIDMTGAAVIPPTFVSAGDFSEGLAAVSVAVPGGKVSDAETRDGYIDKRGSWVIPPRFKYARAFSGGRAHVQDPVRKGWCLIDKAGAIVVGPDPEYGTVGVHSEFRAGLVAVQYVAPGVVRGRYLDRAGKPAFAAIGGWIRPFSEGLAAVEKDRAWGFIDTTGRWVIPPRFPDAGEFQGGLAAVAVGPIPTEDEEDW